MMYSVFAIIGLIALTDACDTISQLLLKHSINTLDLHIDTVRKVLRFVLRLARSPLVWCGFLFSTVSLGVWLFVLTKAPLNFAYSLDSMRYVMIALASVVVLKEKVGLVRWLGILSVVIGIAMVAAG